MGIIKLIQSALGSEQERKYPENEVNTLTRRTAELLKRNASSCHCGGLATPAAQRGNTYKCIRCDHQFSNISYNFGRRHHNGALRVLPKDASQLMDMAYYAAAVRLLKQEDER